MAPESDELEKARRGFWLRAARERAGLSQADAAKAIGLSEASKSTLSAWEAGQREPSPSRLSALARLYRVPVDVFARPQPMPSEALDAALIDPMELQDRVDDIVESMEWAANYIEVLRDDDWTTDNSDLPGFKADIDRLRLVADALVPARVRDAGTRTRLWVAAMEAGNRATSLRRALQRADAEAGREYEIQRKARDADNLARDARDERHRAEVLRSSQIDERIDLMLRLLGPITSAEAKRERGDEISDWELETALTRVGKRRQDGRWVPREPQAGDEKTTFTSRHTDNPFLADQQEEADR